MKIDKPKFIIDPILGVIEIGTILPLIDTKDFQSLGFKRQLGLTSSVFPAANHTRKEHSLGSFERTRRLTSGWLRHGFINREQAFALQVFALYHDIGHGPFSHVTERVSSVNHKDRGLQIIERLKPVIESAECDYQLLYDLAAHTNPLHLAVSDKNFGMEKLDYIERDAFFTIGERPGVEYLAKHVYFIDGKLMVDEVALDQAKDIQEFFIKLSKNVYLRKKSSVLQRLVEKMTHELVKDGLTEEELFSLTDYGLLGRFEVSENSRIRFYYRNFVSGVVPKITIEFKYKSVVPHADLTHKIMKIIGLEDEFFDHLTNGSLFDLDSLTRLEAEVAKLAGIPEDSLLIVPMFSKERFEPKDMHVYSREGRITMLSALYPSHFQAMKEYGKSHLSLRVCTYHDHRRKLYDASEKVKDYFLELVKD